MPLQYKGDNASLQYYSVKKHTNSTNTERYEECTIWINYVQTIIMLNTGEMDGSGGGMSRL